MTNNTGGPAFPSHGSMGEVEQEGMTLRDYFAAKAMQIKNFSVRPYDTTEEIAREAYQMADAMLRARKL
jgi:hypothetical protein